MDNNSNNSDGVGTKTKNTKEKEKEKEKANVKERRKKKPENKYSISWIIKVFTASFVITVVLAVLSNELLGNGMSIAVAVLALIFFIFLGVVFDTIGLSIATADEKPFHSMAARKIESAKYAIKLIRNTEKVSSFCNDIIGDIAGIVSGSTGTAIAADLFLSERSNFIGNLIITALIAAVTVGSKAFGKSVAVNHANDIVNIVSKFIFFFNKFKIKK